MSPMNSRDDSKAFEANRLIAEEYRRLKELRIELLRVIGDSPEYEEERDTLEEIFEELLAAHHKFKCRAIPLVIMPPHG